MVLKYAIYKIFNVFITDHYKNPVPNMIFFASIGTVCGIIVGSSMQKIQDVPDNRDPTEPNGWITSAIGLYGFGIGAVGGLIAGPVLFSLVGLKGVYMACHYFLNS
jgi:hypothetical protein